MYYKYRYICIINIGSLYLILIPFKKPKRMYFIYSIIQTLSFVVIVVFGLDNLIISICMLVIGITRSSIMVPYLLLT